jgi:two-component system phosphate regulon sensor histidine kinase PhoR
VVRPDGSERAVSVNAQPIHDAAGRLAGAVAVARDITAERAAAAREAERLAQLEAAAARAAAVADVALAVNAGSDLATTLRTAITAMTDLLGGRHGALFFREADGRMTGQVGYRFPGAATEIQLDPASVPTTMIAVARRAPLYYTYAEAAPSERALFDRYGFRAATIAPLLAGEELIGVAYVNHAADDRRPSDEEMSFAGALASQCAVAIDKTRLMDRMESAHRRLLAVVDQLPQGVVIVEAPGGRLVLANRAAEGLWGAPLPEAGPLGFGDADGTPFPPGQDPLSLTLATGEGRYGETLTVLRADGSRVAVLANHAPVLDAVGRIVGAVSVLQDVAQLRALDRAKDEFLSVAAHELRNPLTTLHGNLQLLLRRVQRDPDRADDASRLEGIIAQSDRLAQLVARLLDVSRAELGRLDLELAPSDAARVVRRVVDEARGSATDLRLVAETPDSVPVVWDELRIAQVLANLVGNAIKYAPDGELEVTLHEATGDGAVRIDVRDHGPGIPDADKARLFDRYYRGGGTGPEDGSADGLGLGLYISRLIARAHGGDLSVADAPGGGALFTLTVPADPAAAAASEAGRVPARV